MTAGTAVVSVVIPAYNAARFIARTLDTVRAQTFPQHETIVVDDGSADDTAAVVESYFARRGLTGRLVKQSNRGMAAARNAGMRSAAGAFVAFLDSDDLWYPDKLATVLAEFDRHPEADLICHDERTTRDGRTIRVSRRRAPRGNQSDALLFRGNLLSPSATVVRRDAALAIGGFDERPDYLSVEDYDFWIRFSREHQVRFLDRVLGEYVLGEASASRRIVSHHVALERMLRNHFAEYGHSRLVTRIRMRRRLAQVYRSAARQLIAYRESAPQQREFIARMLRMYPLEPRNLAVACLWIGGTLWRRGGHTTVPA